MDYMVINDNSALGLSLKVYDYKLQGYVPLGGVSVISERINWFKPKVRLYCQAVYRERISDE